MAWQRQHGHHLFGISTLAVRTVQQLAEAVQLPVPFHLATFPAAGGAGPHMGVAALADGVRAREQQQRPHLQAHRTCRHLAALAAGGALAAPFGQEVDRKKTMV